APVPDFFHAPAQTLLGQQTDNEIGIGLAVLDAVTARPGGRSEAVAREEGTHFATELPGSQWRVVRQHRLEYFQHRHVLEYTAVATLRQQPGPWHQPQAVTGQPAIASQASGFAHQSGSWLPAAIGQTGPQGGATPYHRPQRQVRTGGQHVHGPFKAA